jgi:predicted phage terminase large subunit-like protein
LNEKEIASLRAYIEDESIRIGGAKNFWTYCKAKSPEYFGEDKPHLKHLCDILQKFWERSLIKLDGRPYTKLMINMPPRHGKSRTLINFCQWVLGKNEEERIIECSYNDDSAGDFSKYTRDGITEEHQEKKGYVFSDFFPDTKIKYGSQSYFKWALEGQHFNYLGAGIKGSVTGKGGSILLIDDPIKLVEEAFNEERLDSIWQWYVGTFLSRGDLEGREPLEIITMTPWCKKDLCGRILDSEDASNWYRVKMAAYDEATDKMLCEKTLSKERYRDLEKAFESMPEVFLANYQMEMVDVKGQLYRGVKTYEKLPVDAQGNSVLESIRNYTDTADEGDDFLCSINYGVYKGEAYVLDVLYSKSGMEITEPLTAKFLFEGKVNRAMIESNNGGRGFARNVERILWEKHQSRHTVIKWFHQSLNKMARILSNSSFVQEHVYFPVNWRDRWPVFYKELSGFLKEGKNKHDDAADCITGLAEDVNGVGGGFYDPSQRMVA